MTTERSAKKPWRSIEPLTGDVPEHWVRPILGSNELVPFTVLPDLPCAIIPTDSEGQLIEDPGSENGFWRDLDELYQEHRGRGRSTPKTLLRQIDFSSKLEKQLGRSGSRKSLVLYPASGDIMRGARTTPDALVVQSKVYYMDASTPDEGAFLVALLNAPSLRRAFVQSRTSGRDFHTNLWRTVPIPRYDKGNDLHRQLAALCKRAEKATDAWIVAQEREFGQVAASSRIRELLDDRGIMGEIDQVVRRLLPDHAK